MSSRTPPITTPALVALVDQANFLRNTQHRPPADVFDDLNAYYHLVEDAVTAAVGLTIKFLGDAALIFFPEDLADAGVIALLQLKTGAGAWFRQRTIATIPHVMLTSVRPQRHSNA